MSDSEKLLQKLNLLVYQEKDVMLIDDWYNVFDSIRGHASTPERLKREKINVLTKILDDVNKIKDDARLAPECDFKHGHLKALTNVLSIVNEEIRITKQNGDPTIKS